MVLVAGIVGIYRSSKYYLEDIIGKRRKGNSERAEIFTWVNLDFEMALVILDPRGTLPKVTGIYNRVLIAEPLLLLISPYI